MADWQLALYYTLTELCTRWGAEHEVLVAYVEHGIIEPVAGDAREHWRFTVVALRRTQKALRLQHVFGINLPGIALALALLEELDDLRLAMRRLQ